MTLIAEESGKDISDLYKEKVNKKDYLPSIEDLRKAFSSEEEFHKYIHETTSYEIFTHEYVAQLAHYLIYRFDMKDKNGNPIKILEVGAGNGRLSHFLRTELSREGDKRQEYEVIATDDASWTEAQGHDQKVRLGVEVQELDYKEATTKLKPDVIISSWMPPNEDWTPVFRDNNVEEYILIGQIDGASGGLDTFDMPDQNHAQKGEYFMTDIVGEDKPINAKQVGNNDKPPFDTSFSHTMSFRKKSF